MGFRDRDDAGRRLGDALVADRAGLGLGPQDPAPVVVGLPRGGVPVAAGVARALGVPLDVVVVRKLGLPWEPEVAFGALGEDGVRVLDDRTVAGAGLDSRTVEAVVRREAGVLEARRSRLRGTRPARPVAGRTVVIVDDGLATGATARAAIAVVRARGAARVVLAVPVAPRGVPESLADVADAIVCLETPARFAGVGGAYDDFGQVDDDAVVRVLASPTAAPEA